MRTADQMGAVNCARKGEPVAGRRVHRRWAAVPGWGLLLLLVWATGCSTTPPAVPTPLVARVYLETKAGEPGVTLRLPVSGVRITVGTQPVITEYDLLEPEVVRGELGDCLRWRLTPAAARDLQRLTLVGRGRRLLLLLNDAPSGARHLELALGGGYLTMFVEQPDAALPELVARLKHTEKGLMLTANQ